jgi:hypothetical protein
VILRLHVLKVVVREPEVAQWGRFALAELVFVMYPREQAAELPEEAIPIFVFVHGEPLFSLHPVRNLLV